MSGKRLSAIIVLAYIAFISLGLPDGLLGVAWPSMRSTFDQPLDALGLLLIASTAGYICSSFISGTVVRLLGVGKLLALSCAATGTALIGYTLVPYWWLIPALGILSGMGAGAIDAGLNSYIAEHYNDRLMQWLHASFGIGITMGPLIMTFGLNIFQTWRIGYAVVGSAQILLAICFAATAHMWRQPHMHQESSRQQDPRPRLTQTLRKGGVWLSLLLFFVYTGVELTLGHWTYTLLTESRNISSEAAGLLTGGFWAMFTVGRFLAGLYASQISSPVVVNAGIGLAGAGAALLWLDLSTWTNLGAIILLGFAVAPIFPGLVSTTYHRVGRLHTANTIGMQIAAAGLGGSCLPALAGILARRVGLEIIPVFLIILIALLLILQFTALHTGKNRKTP